MTLTGASLIELLRGLSDWPACVRVGRKVLYRMEAVRDWLCEQEARKAGANRAVAGRR